MRRLVFGLAVATFLVPVTASATTTGGAGDDVIRGNEAPNDFDGGPGLDVILGRENDDRLAGGPGDDVIVSGRGFDEIDGGLGIDVCFASPRDTIAGCEVVILPGGVIVG